MCADRISGICGRQPAHGSTERQSLRESASVESPTHPCISPFVKQQHPMQKRPSTLSSAWRTTSSLIRLLRRPGLLWPDSLLPPALSGSAPRNPSIRLQRTLRIMWRCGVTRPDTCLPSFCEGGCTSPGYRSRTLAACPASVKPFHLHRQRIS